MKQSESKTQSEPSLPVKSTVRENDSDDSKRVVKSPENSQGHSPSNTRKGLMRQWISSIIASLSYFVIGASLGWPSPVLSYIKRYHKPVNMTHTDETLMVSLFYAGNALMPIPSGFLADWVGRKYSLLYLSILPFASWIFIWVAAPVVMIHIARFLMGLYSGLALTVLPIYLAEIAEPQVRGVLAFVLQLFTNVGLLFSYIVGMFVTYGTLAIILGVLPVCHFFLLLLIPRSPYWLILKGKDREASKTLAWLRGGKVGNEDVEKELNSISQSITADAIKPNSFKMLFTTKSYRKALIIVEALSASQRFSGMSALMAYISITVPVMPEHGITANVSATITGCANILGISIALPLIDRLGRIRLMIISCIGCGVAMLLAAVWFYTNNHNIQDAPWKWVPLTVFCMYGMCMNLGLGPIPALVQGELFPSHLKGKASAITVMVLAGSSVVVNFTYIPIAVSAGYWCNFLIYTVVIVACLVFTWTYAFETKGKTLVEIQNRLTQ